MRMSDADRVQHRVAITGIGPITAVGTGTDGLWDGLRRERSGVRRLTRFDPTHWRARLAAQVDDFEADDHMDGRTAKKLDRFGHFSIATARLALRDAGLEDAPLDRERVGVLMGSALGGGAFAEAQAGALYVAGSRGVDPRVALTTFVGAASCVVAIEFGFTGPNETNAMSCASILPTPSPTEGTTAGCGAPFVS